MSRFTLGGEQPARRNRGALARNRNPSAIKSGVTPYALKFYIYLFFANVLTLVIVVRWIRLFGFVVSIAFGLVYAYLAILVGWRVFGKKNL